MNIENMKIKENIVPEEIAEAIEFIVNSCFVNGGYNPYFRSFAERIAVMRFFLDGIEYGAEDSWYEMIGNKDIEKLINKFFADPKFIEQAKIMGVVRENASEIIEFKKQRLIHGADAVEYIARAVGEFKDFVHDLDVALGNLVNLDLSQINAEDIENARELARKMKDGNVVQVLKEAANFDVDKATQEIIDAKNAEIESLKKQLADKERGAEVIVFKKESDE